MIQHEAGIPAGDAIFEQETSGFSSLINFAMFAAKSSENTAKASVEKRFARLGKEEDLNYGGEGNKRINQQDVNYAFSLEKMEKKEEILGSMSRVLPSGVNKSLILEKIFGGVTNRLENEFTFEEVQDKNKLRLGWKMIC